MKPRCSHTHSREGEMKRCQRSGPLSYHGVHYCPTHYPPILRHAAAAKERKKAARARSRRLDKYWRDKASGRQERYGWRRVLQLLSIQDGPDSITDVAIEIERLQAIEEKHERH